MSNSDIKPPSTYYMPGARIKMIVSENDKLKVREGKINSVNKEMKTIDITLQTIDKKIAVKLDDIKEVIKDDNELHGRALIVSRAVYSDEPGFLYPSDLKDVGHDSPTQTQTLPASEPSSTSNIVIINQRTDSCVYTFAAPPSMNDLYMCIRASRNPFFLVLS